MANIPDPYATLGIDRNATAADIKRAYRTLVRAYHPDLAEAPDEGSSPRLQEIYLAYAVLGNPERRARYDRQHPRVAHGEPAATGRSHPTSDGAPIRFGPVRWTRIGRV